MAAPPRSAMTARRCMRAYLLKIFSPSTLQQVVYFVMLDNAVQHGSKEIMKYPRRELLRLATAAIAFSTILRAARSQTYPTRPVHMVVAATAGSSPDLVARLIAQWLSERIGGPV